MNIDHIRTFLEVAATGNFNRAAERLHITQSTVSARVKALEDRLDHTLFIRNRNGVELTAAGQHFQRYAVTVVRAWEQARQEIALPKGFRAIFGMGAQISLWERLVTRWAVWMRKEVSDVALRLEADYSDSLMQQLSGGLLDIGVMYIPRHLPGLVIEKLLEERLVLVSTSPRELTLEWREDYVFVHWGRDFVTEHGKTFPDIGSPAVSVGLGALGLQYLLENGGSGYFPLRVVRPLLAKQRLFLVPEAPTFQRPAYMVYPVNPVDEDLLQLAIGSLRHITALEGED